MSEWATGVQGVVVSGDSTNWGHLVDRGGSASSGKSENERSWGKWGVLRLKGEERETETFSFPVPLYSGGTL